MLSDIEFFYNLVIEARGKKLPEDIIEAVHWFEDLIFITKQIKKRAGH